MAVGYGYIRDTEPTQVDWGQITKDARESIKSIEKDRQARRDKIDENYREFTKMLAERPVGGDTQYQAFMGKYSALVSASMLANLGKLKRGEIGEQQYNTCRATVTSGAEGMIATGKAYIAGHDTAAALQVGNGSAMTKYSNEQSQKLFSLEGVEPMIDPATCETSYAIVGEDGEKEIVDVTQGLRRAVATQAAFDTTGLIERILKNAPLNDAENSLGGKEEGQFLKQITVGGKTQIVVDTDYIRTQVKAGVQQNSHVFDILKLNKTGYEIVALPDAYYALTTQEERDAMLSDLQKKTKNLYIDKSDTPLVSDAQRLEAENFLVEQIKDGAQRRSKATPFKAVEFNLIRKFDFVARNQEKLPADFINQVLTPEEQLEYKAWRKKQGVPGEALSGILQNITDYVDFTKFKQGEEGTYKGRAQQFLDEAGKAFGFTFKFTGTNSGLTKGKIKISYGDEDPQKVSLSGKSEIEILNDLVTKMYQLRPLKELAIDLQLKGSQPTGSKLLD
jgi:hypothetical protein